jgi:hypothetical protein
VGEEWKEVKVGCVFKYNQQQRYSRKSQEMINVAHLGEPEPLGKLLSAEAERRGYDHARWGMGPNGSGVSVAKKFQLLKRLSIGIMRLSICGG